MDLCGARRAKAARAAGRRVGISHNQVFFEPHRRLAELLATGELGDLRRAALPIAEREKPPGARSWNTKAKRLQWQLIDRWHRSHGA